MKSPLVITFSKGLSKSFHLERPLKGCNDTLGVFSMGLLLCHHWRSMVLFRSFTYFLSTKASRKHACMMCHRGVFSTGAMGALASAIFGHFSTVGKNFGC